MPVQKQQLKTSTTTVYKYKYKHNCVWKAEKYIQTELKSDSIEGTAEAAWSTPRDTCATGYLPQSFPAPLDC